VEVAVGVQTFRTRDGLISTNLLERGKKEDTKQVSLLLSTRTMPVHSHSFGLFLFFEIGSGCVAQVSLKLVILLPQTSECWDYRHILPYPAHPFSFLCVQKKVWGHHSSQFLLCQGKFGIDYAS
jgi:hypothetical protein